MADSALITLVFWVNTFQVPQVESENKRKRSRHTLKVNMRSKHAPKGQRAHSPGQRPGYDETMSAP